MGKLLLWLRALRAPFFIGPIMSAIIAAALAFDEGYFSWIYIAVCIIIIVAINAGINLTNDYFDYISKNDKVNKYFNVFSGGSRVIQEKLISPRLILIGAIISFLAAAALGAYMVLAVNFNLLWFGLAGVISGFFYTAPSFKAVYRGWGEILVFLLAGPVAVTGSYFLITGAITLKSILISIPHGLLVMLILFINEFPDYSADRKVNKNHLVVRLGRKKSSYLYVILITAAYLAVLIPVVFSVFPLFLAMILITLPLTARTAFIVLKKYKNEKELFPAQANTIIIALASGVLVSAGFIFDKIFILP